MKVAFKTIGCKSNFYDSNVLLEGAVKFAKITAPKNSADFYIVNTCTVTESADKKSRQAIRALRHAHPDSKIIAFGCGVTVNRKMYEEIKELDYVANDKDEVIKIIIPKVPKGDGSLFRRENRPLRTRAIVKIQDGCNYFCAYCIIPFARGRQRSFSLKQILEEIKMRKKQGFKEIVLTGINIGTWQAPLPRSHATGAATGEQTCTAGQISSPQKKDNLGLVDLILLLLKNTKNVRFRLSSIAPQDFSEKFIKILRHPRFCKHMHMSLQSGSDKILKLMRRHYTTSLFAKVCEKFRKICPDIGITTDIITGFPGETEKDFNDTCRFAEKIGFSKIHVFPYSQRPGTAAYSFKNQIDEKTKIRRSEKLRKLSDKLSENFRKSLLGKKQEVLFEIKKDGFWTGFSSNYIKVFVKSKENLKNHLKQLKFVKIFKNSVLGELS